MAGNAGLKDQLAKMLADTGLDPNAVQEGIEDAEVLSEDEDDMTPVIVDDETVPDDDRYDEGDPSDADDGDEKESEEESEDEVDDYEGDDVEEASFEELSEANNVPDDTQPVNLLATYGDYSPKQVFRTTFSQRVNIVDDGDATNLVGRMSYITNIEGNGSAYDEASASTIAAAVNASFVANGAQRVERRMSDGSVVHSASIQCMTTTLRKSANAMRKQGESIIESTDGAVSSVVQVMMEESFRKDAVLSAALLVKTDADESEAYLYLVCANTGSYTVTLRAALTNLADEKFKFQEGVENIWSAFPLIVEAAQVGNTFADIHAALGRDRWFSRYEVAVFHPRSNHTAAATFRWEESDAAVFSRV